MSSDLVTAGASSTRDLYEQKATWTRVADLSRSSRARSTMAAWRRAEVASLVAAPRAATSCRIASSLRAAAWIFVAVRFLIS